MLRLGLTLVATLRSALAVLTGMGITMMMTAELEDSYLDLRFSPHGTAFLTDAIIMQRYIELKGQLQRVMAVVKVRGSAHSKDLRAFEITEHGIVMGETLGHYEGLLTGSPALIASAPSKTGDKKPHRRRGQPPTRR
jgi:circadian clock protein KaiC